MRQIRSARQARQRTDHHRRSGRAGSDLEESATRLVAFFVGHWQTSVVDELPLVRRLMCGCYALHRNLS
jgi:hypothetical protein